MSTNKHATIRYNTLDKCLSNSGRKYYLEDLIEACNHAIYEFTGQADGVKRRQIYDDIRFMKSEQGYNAPIKSFRNGRKVFYRYEDLEFSINKQEITPKEKLQLQQALEVLSRFEGLPDFEWIHELKARLDSQLPNIKDESEHKYVSFQYNPFLKGMEFFTPIYNAIRYQRTIEVEYQNYKKKKKEVIKISPYHLKQFNNRWFLLGQVDGFEVLTNVALDRIISCNELIDKYQDPSIEFEDYFDDVIGVTLLKDEPVSKVLLQISASLYPYIASKPIHGSQKLKEKESDFVLIELEVKNNYELKALLLSYGEHVQVISPPSLVKELKQITQKMYNNYKCAD